MRALVIILVAACSAYDHDLGPEPFLCGPTDPRCPEDYTCMSDPSTGKDICYAKGTGPSFMCADDSAHEPNETLATSTTTPVDMMKTYTLPGLAICPATDIDTFAVTISTANETLTATITYEATPTVLSATIQNLSGQTLATAAAVSGTPNTVRAVASSLSAGKYFVQVSGPNTSAASQNNYSLMLGVTP